MCIYACRLDTYTCGHMCTCISLELTFVSLKPAVINVPVATTFNCTADKYKHKYVRMNTCIQSTNSIHEIMNSHMHSNS